MSPRSSTAPPVPGAAPGCSARSDGSGVQQRPGRGFKGFQGKRRRAPREAEGQRPVGVTAPQSPGNAAAPLGLPAPEVGVSRRRRTGERHRRGRGRRSPSRFARPAATLKGRSAAARPRDRRPPRPRERCGGSVTPSPRRRCGRRSGKGLIPTPPSSGFG